MIRWIVEDTLGTAPFSDELKSIATIVDVRELADKAGNDPHAIRIKVEEGVAALQKGKRVVVTCDFGVSRSNAIAAGILAKWKNSSLDWALSETVQRTHEESIKLDVINAVRLALFDAPVASDPGCILITGATGFLGRNLLSRLSNDTEVFAPSRNEMDLLGAPSGLERVCRDRHVGQIIHLAHPRIYTTNEALGQSLTILKNLVDTCRVLGSRLILPSGGVVFSGYQSAGMSVGVDAAPRPKGIYGETKYLQEILIETAVRNGEIEATIVRVGPTYGPGGERPRLIRYFHQMLLEGRRIVTHVYRDRTPARLDLLYIDDTVAGLEKVLHDRVTPLHHLSSGISYTPREIAERIASLLRRTPEFGEMLIDDDASNVYLDSSNSRQRLNWAPTVQIDEGLERTLASFAA